MRNKFDICKFYAYLIIGLCVKATEEYCKICKIPEHKIATNIFAKVAEISSWSLRSETM